MVVFGPGQRRRRTGQALCRNEQPACRHQRRCRRNAAHSSSSRRAASAKPGRLERAQHHVRLVGQDPGQDHRAAGRDVGRELRRQLAEHARLDVRQHHVVRAAIEIGGRRDIGYGVAHGNAEAGRSEQWHIILAIAENRDVPRRDIHKPRQFVQRMTLIGEWMRDVEIIGLRTRDIGASAKRTAQIVLQARQESAIIANSDDLGCRRRPRREVRDDDGIEPYSPLLQIDMRPVRIANAPVLPGEHPRIRAGTFDRRDSLGDDIRRDEMTCNDRQIWSDDDPAVEARDKCRDAKAFDNHLHSAHRAAANDRKGNSRIAQFHDRSDRSIGQ